MDYRALGASGLRVSPICLGTLQFGTNTAEAEASAIVGEALDAGVNFIDTAASYGAGRGEEMVGRLIRANRDRWVVATKVGTRTGEGPNDTGTSRRHLRAAMERSLRRLGTDHV